MGLKISWVLIGVGLHRDTGIGGWLRIDEEAEIGFKKRRKVMFYGIGIWMLSNLLRIEVISNYLNLPQEAQAATFTLGAIAAFGTVAWASLCTRCKGWIKLNGKTCSKCGHVFNGAIN